MIARARLLAVLAVVAGGAVAIIASTQTWLQVTLAAGATDALSVPGASALPLLAPLSLAALALGLALAVVGRVLRYVFGVIAALIGGTILVGAGRVALERPLDAVATVVTTSTGLSGTGTIAELVAGVAATAWPFAAAVAGLSIGAGGLWALGTAHRWSAGGRRYQRGEVRDQVGAGSRAPETPRDAAIDSWDDLSHGGDPTAR